ncbi:MAG: hypothetical protein WBN18_14710 [Flavobacteriaceae bacterium]
MKFIPVLVILLVTLGCQEGNRKEIVGPEVEPLRKVKSTNEIREALEAKGFQTFDYVDKASKDTILMQQYVIVCLKRGPIRSGSKAEADSLQQLHLAHLGRMYNEGFADISGPFGDDGEIRGITIYNTPTQELADSLAHLDPMVRSGRLVIEVHPWWAAKGFPLR